MTNNSQNTDLLLNSVPNPIKEPLIHAGEDVNTSVQGKSPSKFLIFFQSTPQIQILRHVEESFLLPML